MRQLARLLALSAADVWAVVALRPDVGELARHLAQPQEWTRRVGLNAAVAELAGALIWVLSLWLAIGLLAAVAARGPGVLGSLGDRFARTVLPRGVYRLVAGAAGFGILFAPVAAGAATPRVPAAAGQIGVHALAPAPAPTVPTAPTTAAPGGMAQPPVPAPVWPTSAPRSSTTSPSQPAAPASRERVVVRPGDSLWLITAARLGPHPDAAAVAAQWPRWYAANRATIGPDPDLLIPGQVLHAPDHGPA